MKAALLTIEIRYEQDVVLARQRARQIAELLGLERQDQTRIATAVSEIARNAFQYAGVARVEYQLEGQSPQSLIVKISDRGPGIAALDLVLSGRYRSTTGLGLGILGARRLMDDLKIKSEVGKGTTVWLTKHLHVPVTKNRLELLSLEMARQEPQSPFEEVRQQNQELVGTLEELQRRQIELAHLNHELEDTNRGVVALYAELDEQADYLRRASETKSRFLSNMSHEFRTPLNSILSLSRLLLDHIDGDLTEEQEKQVYYISKSATDLSELVNDLLDLAKVEAGRVVVRPKEFEIGDLFAALRGMLRPLLSSNNSVNLIFEEPQAIPIFHTDEGKISQILRNLISNALKYTERGEVRVAVSLGYPDLANFSVSDTGSGIAPEDQQRIFEEFTQIDSPLQKRIRGTGLGLPLSAKLAELLGGGISVESELGVGSTFHATIPRVYTGPGESTHDFPGTLKLDPSRLPLLVIEDNRETLFIYENYLKHSEFQAIPARTLAQARRILREIRPAVILTDILLEAEATWNFVSELKANNATKHIPIMVITMIENEQKARAVGADAFAVKPVGSEWLLDQLRLLLRPRETDKILLIDDDQIARYLMRGSLSGYRYEIIEAGCGREGLRRAIEEHPRAIFLDLSMPDISGFEVLEILKADSATRDIPVIVHTAKILTKEEIQSLSANSVSILSKNSPESGSRTAVVREALLRAGLT